MPQIFVIGDSISVQYGPYLESYLKPEIEYARKGSMTEALKNLDIPTGANGGDSRAVLEHVEFLLKTGVWHPDLFVLNCGLHDIKTNPATGEKQVPLADYAKNLEAIFTSLKAKGIRTLWVRTTPVMTEVHNGALKEFHRFAEDVLAYNEVADEAVARFNVETADLFGFTEWLGGAERFCDHVHYAEPVRMLQAAFLNGVIRTLLAK